MPTEFWYGWIPILSHKLLDLGVGGGQDNSQSCARSLKFTEAQLTNRQRIALQEQGYNDDANKNWWVREKFEWLGDGPNKKQHTVCILLSDEQEVSFVIIFSNIDSESALAVSKVEHKKLTGMIRFTVECQGCKEKVIAKQIFALVRDVYHRHVYTHSDFGVMPLRARSYDEGASLIWEKHYGVRVMIENHHKLRLAIQGITGKRGWLDAYRMCRAQIGELLYAESLAKLNDLRGDQVAACKRARQSYENMSQMIQVKFNILTDISLHIFALTVLAGGVAIHSFWNHQGDWLGKMLFLVVIIGYVVCFMFYRSRTLKNKITT